MWTRRDWIQFYHMGGKRLERYRPPRPVYLSPASRVLPAAGFSLRELDDVGLTLDQAESLGLPVDAGRLGSYGPNVSALRDYVRSARARE